MSQSKAQIQALRSLEASETILKHIAAKIAEAKKVENMNWGHSGSAAHVMELLEEVENFLRDEES